MPYRVRRRTTRQARGLTQGEHMTLMSGGHWPEGSGFAFAIDTPNGLSLDEAAMREAWDEYRDELIAEAAEQGLIPWAARHFEGMPGKVSPYEHLRPDPVIRDCPGLSAHG